ncbi:hypothetical protein CLV67_118153 [Actinoplanes italicus]|uniref:Uncharacterized protein n=1 Tax=Actinoplanes italicus TaxID=113567 RepID=A0A2T0K1Z4_9ACTN|nr:hypothetical protein CLV67_118153 [Actinoplanes italicus]
MTMRFVIRFDADLETFHLDGCGLRAAPTGPVHVGTA